MSTVDEVMVWLMAGGSVSVVVWFASWALEKMDWYQAIGSQGRSAIILVLSALLGVAAMVMMAYPEVYEAIKPYLQVVLTTIIAWLGSQVAHRADAERR